MKRFNYILVIMDFTIIYLPFLAINIGWIGLSQFACGFAMMWIFLNVKNGKVNLKRYTINEDV